MIKLESNLIKVFISKKNEQIMINIKECCNESYGFRFLFFINESLKTSEYYSRKILKGKFKINNIQLKVYECQMYK